VDDTIILGAMDVIGINAFYPLTDEAGAGAGNLLRGGYRVAAKVRKLAQTWRKPVMFTEIGYTTRSDPALRPWEWPDGMADVRVDEAAQANALFGLVAPMLQEPCFAGFFVWRVYADPDDVSQEAEWGFSPRGKRAELVLRDAARWAPDPWDAATLVDGSAEAGRFSGQVSCRIWAVGRIFSSRAVATRRVSVVSRRFRRWNRTSAIVFVLECTFFEGYDFMVLSRFCELARNWAFKSRGWAAISFISIGTILAYGLPACR
jgi:hypothetical protein